jgi:Protein of unknown function (DUF3302)
MVLDYVALAILVLIVLLLVYGIIGVWGMPYEIAKARNHPHQDAIGAATWVSLATLGALWPFLWIWAMAYRPGSGWGLSNGPRRSDLAESITKLESRLAALEASKGK